MRLYKRGSVWWLADGTYRESTRCTHRPAAELYKARRERERADPAHAAKDAATLADAVRDTLAELRARRRADGSPTPKGTIEVYECKSGHLLRLLPARLAELDVATVEEYFVTRRDEGASYSTMYKDWVALAKTLKGAHRRGLFGAGIQILKPLWVTPSYVPRETFLPWEFVPRLLAELEPHRRSVVAFILATGARWSEAMRYRPGDLNRTTWEIHVKGTKTKKANRRFIVPEAFRGLLDLVGEPFGGWANVGRDLEVACRRAQRALARETLDADYTPLFPCVSPNDLRRTFASLLVQGGTSLEDVAIMLGHEGTTMVYEVYGQHTPESLSERVKVRAPIVRSVYLTPKNAVETTDNLDTPGHLVSDRKPHETAVFAARPVRFELTTFGFEGRGQGRDPRRRWCA